MKLIQTKLQIQNAQKATRLDLLSELDKRNALDEKLKDELYRLETGAEGEQKVLKYIEKFGQAHWCVLKNVWLDYYGRFECDLILITSHAVLILETKNYVGDFTYKNNQCYLNGKKIGHNAFSQALRASVNFENILRDANHSAPIQSGVVFTGKHSNVQIFDEVNDLHITTLNQFRSLLIKIAQAERNYQGPSLNANKIVNLINSCEIENPFVAEPISDGIKERMQLGVKCSVCFSGDINIGRKHIHCECGALEPYENAVVRTICEYGVIYNENKLNQKRIIKFCGGHFSRETLRKYLKKYFKPTNQKSNHFINKGLPFKYLINTFDLSQKQVQILKNYD